MTNLIELNFPKYPLRVKNTENGWLIFDIVRKKFISLQPEEWVRQHSIHFIINELGISNHRISVEHRVTTGSLHSRFDIASFYSDGSTQLLVECKAPKVRIDERALHQAMRYAQALTPKFMLLTNGIQHFFAAREVGQDTYRWTQNWKEINWNE